MIGPPYRYRLDPVDGSEAHIPKHQIGDRELGWSGHETARAQGVLIDDLASQRVSGGYSYTFMRVLLPMALHCFVDVLGGKREIGGHGQIVASVGKLG